MLTAKALWWLTVATATLALACQPGTRPNVVLVTIDTLRSDHCSTYGYPLDTTPNLTQVAEAGWRFDTAYAPMPTTAPSHATLLTSLYPLSHGVVRNGLTLAPEHVTLTEILAQHGYRTDAVVSSFVLNRRFGLGQGFETYADRFPPGGGTISMPVFAGHRLEPGEAFDRTADATTDAAIERIRARAPDDRPFFLLVHYMDPHEPYVPPAPFREAFAPAGREPDALEREIGLYDGEVAFTDHHFGRMVRAIDEMGLGGETLLVVTSDHGEGLMRHGIMGHSFHLYEEAVSVPLVFRWPGKITANQAFTEPVELVDIVPTILDLLEIEGQRAELRFQGRSIARVLLGRTRASDPNRPILLHRRAFAQPVDRFGTGRFQVFRRGSRNLVFKGRKFGIRAGRWKYIQGGEEGPDELFDLLRDPWEMRNLEPWFRDKASRLNERLAGMITAKTGAQSREPAIQKDDAERLEALGYTQ